MKPALVVLAAGLGSRFGGDKQTAPLGPGGATLMEYAIYDAIRAGFGRIVPVVRAEMHGEMQASLDTRLRGRATVTCVVQEAGRARSRPWGTAHAVLAAAAVVREPFAVANADDFYGRESFATLGDFLTDAIESSPPIYAIAAFPLGETLSDSGAVNRAACETDAGGWLRRITEVGGLTRDARDLPEETPVSMNLWGFTPALFGQLARGFEDFRRVQGTETTGEFLLPDAIGSLVSAGEARVRVLGAGGRWCGVTYAADAPKAAAHLAALTESGAYPGDLWA